MKRSRISTRSARPRLAEPARQLGRAVPSPAGDDEPDVEIGIDVRERLERDVDALVGTDRTEGQKQEIGVALAGALGGESLLGRRRARTRRRRTADGTPRAPACRRGRARQLARWCGACVTIRSAWRSVERVSAPEAGHGLVRDDVVADDDPGGCLRGRAGGSTGTAAPSPDGATAGSSRRPRTRRMRSTARRQVRGSCQSSMNDASGGVAPA